MASTFSSLPHHGELYRDGPRAGLKLPPPSGFKPVIFDADFDRFLEDIILAPGTPMGDGGAAPASGTGSVSSRFGAEYLSVPARSWRRVPVATLCRPG